MKTEFSHDINVDYPMSETMQFFTPKGEESWVPGWDPRYIHPTHGDTREEMLFTTGHGGETTFWTCMRWEPEAGRARYLRLTPGSRAAFVDVHCRPAGAGRTSVRVTYETHALSDAGRAQMSEMTQEAFDEMIDEWAQLIRDMSK